MKRFLGILLALVLVFTLEAIALPSPVLAQSLSITDDNYEQATQNFSVPIGTTLTNSVTWVGTDLEGRGGYLFIRFDTAATVELLPADLTVTYGGSPVAAIKVGFSGMEFHVADIPDLGTGGTISYSVTFNKDLALNNSRIEIATLDEPSAHSNTLSHNIAVIAAPPLPEVWVDDDYTPDGYNDGHTWDYDAFAKIQDGIDAVAGSVVHVATGTYYENITLVDGVQVLGAGADVTIIDGGGKYTVIGADDSIIAGFTITGADWGVWTEYSSLTVTKNVITGNEIGVLCWNSAIISNNIIITNSQSGIFCSGSSPTIINNIIVSNSREGIFCEGSSPTITNNIITNSQFGIRCWSTSLPTIDYNDVWSNGVDYEGCSAGPGDKFIDPLFVGPTGNDYHLRAASPCIDAGTNVGAPTEDIEGNPRPIDGDGDSIAITDMGVYEYVPIPPIATFSAEPIAGVAPLAVEFTDKSTGDITSCLWDFGDGSTSDEENPSHTYSMAGIYTVSLDVSGPGGADTETKEDYIIVYEQEEATIDFNPNTLNLKSKGKMVTVYIELPESYNVEETDISTVMLNGIVPALAHPTDVGDYDSDGVSDLMVKFDRSDVQDVLEPGNEVEVTISGQLTDGTSFEGADTIRVIAKGKK